MVGAHQGLRPRSFFRIRLMWSKLQGQAQSPALMGKPKAHSAAQDKRHFWSCFKIPKYEIFTHSTAHFWPLQEGFLSCISLTPAFHAGIDLAPHPPVPAVAQEIIPASLHCRGRHWCGKWRISWSEHRWCWPFLLSHTHPSAPRAGACEQLHFGNSRSQWVSLLGCGWKVLDALLEKNKQGFLRG